MVISWLVDLVLSLLSPIPLLSVVRVCVFLIITISFYFILLMIVPTRLCVKRKGDES